ncbi:Organic cation transporter protein [Orchesella cincta]|uniref:Organic cation transporter protein n=1 Tax=Orchesella cincta TaxID=48709 RepID=A0A1D2MH71_ORCCI|nr:Organic cation transporter protein [Orchesella cincta]
MRDWGRYQFRQHLYHILAAFLAGIHMLSLTMVAPTPQHRCYIEELDVNDTSPTFSIESLRPYIPINDDHYDSCKKYDPTTNETIVCGYKEHVYDKTYHLQSNVITWDLVCDQRWLRALIQSFYMGGVLLGAFTLGPLADKFGRKTIFYISGLIQLCAGLACAFISNFYVYCGILLLYGCFGSGGAYVTGFVLTMELVGPSKRTLCGTAFSAAFAIGVMMDAVWGAMIKNVMILQAVFALHSLVLVGHWWLVDESIRWLWGQGRTKEALKIAEKAALTNGVRFDDKVELRAAAQQPTSDSNVSFGVSDLFKTRNLRSRTLNVAFNWFSNSLVYYGLSLNTGNLFGNPFVMLFLIGLAELPGYLIVIFFVDITGRRCLCSFLMFVGGFACIIVAFIPKGIAVTVLVLIGKMAIAGSFAIIYNYTAELFPTVVRNSAVGLGATAARFSGLLTPLLTLLDSLDKELPTIIFGAVAIASALLTLFLPETLHKEMPQTIEDGEHFGIGDTAYKNCFEVLRSTRHGKPNAAENIEAKDRLNPAAESP